MATRRVAIMQPYFLPYLGYWQLMRDVDVFVVYDEIEFSKRGWIHRNRYLKGGEPAYFTIPLKKDSNVLPISQRFLADDSDRQMQKALSRLENAYRDAPFFDEGIDIAKSCFLCSERNLFSFVLHSIQVLREFLCIDNELVVSSDVETSTARRGQDRVLGLCEDVGATHYVNPPGGRSLYSPEPFADRGIRLLFQDVVLDAYPQGSLSSFVPGLSILDLIMFVGRSQVVEMLATMSVSEP